METFKEIEGFKGYQVSDEGTVINTNYRGCGYTVVLKGEVTQDGYRQVTISKDGVKKRIKVHRLVALAFVPNPDGKPSIDHIDTNRLNNKASNLRWVTNKENSNNPLTRHHISSGQLGLVFTDERKRNISEARKGKCIGDNNHNYGKHLSESQKDCIRKSVVKIDNDGNVVGEWRSVNDAAEATGVCASTISKYCRGKRNCKGYTWKYK